MMGIVKGLQVATRVGGKTLYHLTAGAVVSPRNSRAFLGTVANAIVDFQNGHPLELPVVTLEKLCPGLEHLEVPLIVRPASRLGLPYEEFVCLAKLVRSLSPRTIFEIGTAQGRTTSLMAEQTNAEARIYTLDLPPDQRAKWELFVESSDGAVGVEFRRHPLRGKISQLYGDSRTFDFSPYTASMDLVFIDGDHTYEFVKPDTENALRMAKPGGLILWDDYSPRFPGVVKYLNELAKTRAISRIHNTRLACYRHT
jgi:predicted O-methyltransferase YrrM